MWQNIVVLAIVAAAGLYLGYLVYRSIVGRGKSCGGCGTCPSKLSKGNLVQLDTAPRPKESSTTTPSQPVRSPR